MRAINSEAEISLFEAISALTSVLVMKRWHLAAALELEDLFAEPIFLPWKEIGYGEKKKKVPFNANDYRKLGSSVDPFAWGNWDAANRARRRLLANGDSGGVGIALGVHERLNLILVGLDLDNVIEPGSGKLDMLALEVIKRFDTRVEISPGKLGVKLLGFVPLQLAGEIAKIVGNMPDGQPRSRVTFARGKHEEFAFDWASRYYTITNDLYGDFRSEIRQISVEEICWFIEVMGPRYQGYSVGANPKLVDRSGSGIAFRFVLARYYAGEDEESAMQALLEDNGDAGNWAKRSDERQLQRVVKNALVEFERRKKQTPAVSFDEFESTHPDVARLNRRHAIAVISGKTLIATFMDDGSVDFGSDKDLHLRYSNDLTPTLDGKKHEPVSKQWLQHPERRSYHNGVGFHPSGNVPPGKLNLWRGWATFPEKSASCALFLLHLREVICDSDEVLYAYLIGYLAHALQNPDQKPGVALVFRGKKGAGKDTVEEYLGTMFGQQYVRPVSQASHVTGQFNSRLETTFFLSIQEGFWAGDHRAEAVLKNLITAPRIEIERKGVNSFSMENVVRVMITANEDWVVPASRDERRYAVFEVSDRRIRDRPYFRALRAEMEGDGPNALHHFLLNYDISNFDVRTPPITIGLFKQKLESLRNCDRWLFELLSRGQICDCSRDAWEAGTILIDRESFQDDYRLWMRRNPHQGPIMLSNKLGERIRELCQIKSSRPVKGGKRVWRYQLPALLEARAQFAENMGVVVDWDR